MKNSNTKLKPVIDKDIALFFDTMQEAANWLRLTDSEMFDAVTNDAFSWLMDHDMDLIDRKENGGLVGSGGQLILAQEYDSHARKYKKAENRLAKLDKHLDKYLDFYSIFEYLRQDEMDDGSENLLKRDYNIQLFAGSSLNLRVPKNSSVIKMAKKYFIVPYIKPATIDREITIDTERFCDWDNVRPAKISTALVRVLS